MHRGGEDHSKRGFHMMHRNRRNWTVTKIVIVLLLVAQGIVAENRISFVKGEKNQLMLRLSNADPIAGMQFSINARGVVLKSFEGIDRATSSALSVYQYPQGCHDTECRHPGTCPLLASRWGWVDRTNSV